MKMTVTKPLTLKTKTGPKLFFPGETFNVDLEKAQPYIEQGFLKPVEDLKLLDGLTESCMIEWKSPIFGLLTGVIEMIPGDGTLVVDHPLTKGLADQTMEFIHVEWITRVVS